MPSEPFWNTTYHVRRTFWVYRRSGTLQVSDSLLITTLPEVAPSLLKSSSGFTTWVGSGQSSTCAESRTKTAIGQALPGRTSHACWRHPTQEAYWYLPWDCYLYRDSIHYSHSRGILTLAVDCCWFSLSSPLCVPLKRQHCQLHGCPLNFHSCSHCYSGHKPPRVLRPE